MPKEGEDMKDMRGGGKISRLLRSKDPDPIQMCRRDREEGRSGGEWEGLKGGEGGYCTSSWRV